MESVNYSDNVDNSAAVGALHDLLLAEHENYLNLDLHDMTADEAALSDTRIHCVLYLLAPHSFTTLDAKFIEQISPLAPVIPVVNKADAMTDQERDAFLLKVREKIDAIAEDLGQPVIYNFDASAQDGVLKADPGSIFATICEDSSDERVYLWGKPGQTWRPSDLGTLQESLFESNTHMTGLIRSTHQKTISLLRMRRMQQEQQRLEAEAEVQKQAEERRVAESAQRLVLQLEEESRLKETENAVIAKRSQSFSYYFSRSSSKTAPTARGSSSARGALVSAAGSPVSSTDNPLSPQSASASQASASKKDCMIQ